MPARSAGTPSCSRASRDWDKLLGIRKATLTAEEQAFLDGPVNELCAMIDDWDIRHNRADLPPRGLGTSSRRRASSACSSPRSMAGSASRRRRRSMVVSKIASRSVAAGITVMVPNSLGPGELLEKYGTPEQKEKYLAPPRQGAGSAVLRADRPACRFGCGGHARRRRRRLRDVQRQEDARRPAELGQALHHAGAGRDAARPRLPPARSGSPARRGREPRHHAGAGPRRLSRASRSAAATIRRARRS